MRGSLKAVALAYLGLVAALPESVHSIQDDDYQENDIITRDVCVVGGGSGGTYAATRLRQLGQSVVVIEKESIMGGHTNTYTDPTSGQTIDYGVVVFHNISVVQNYFAHYNIALATTGFPSPNTTEYIDFRTGEIVGGYTPANPIASLGLWAAQLAKYPFLVTGINPPYPVPADLLLPFRDFVNKYNLGDLVQTILQLGQGYADLLDQPTLYAIKLFGPSLLQTLETGYIATAVQDNHVLYDAATAEYVFSACQNFP
jgi:phytoene dehydrogenase-like protein